ncbi:MAG: metallophosphoesterase family protein [Myxococcales bacterium]|nr:metallophosphoesterase family protein [Myxococcales bacterium]
MRAALLALGARCLGLLLLLFFALNLSSSRAEADPADTDDERAASGPVPLVAQGAEYDYWVQSSPLPAERYGAIALFDHEGGKPGESRPQLLPPIGAGPKGWPLRGLDQAPHKRGRAPLASRANGESCECKTQLGDSSVERQAALYASHRFSLSPKVDLSRHSLLELRLLYRDGARVFLNGRQIASRGFPSASDVLPSARATKGPEWEEFLIPLTGGMVEAGENVLSIEVRPSAHAHGVRLDASLSLREVGRVLRGPMVQRVRPHKASIRFDTDLPSKAYVEYGATSALGQRALSARSTLVRHHRVELGGLKPGQAVHYRVVSSGRPGATHVFHVPPEAPEPLRFAVYGDVRGGHRVHSEIANALLGEAIDFVIVTGDMVMRGSDEGDWQRFFAVAGPLLARLPYYPVAGNHDTGTSGDERRRMSELFALWPAPADRPATGAWHSFDISGVHFVMLDSNNYRHEAQLKWLEKDLLATRTTGARAIFAVVHAGPYSRGLHLGHSYAAEHYAPLLREHGVTLLFSGHDHLYQRGTAGGLNYMVSGGGGAPLYSVRCGKRGKPRCKIKDGMKHVAKEFHYILITVFPGHVRACPKRVDGTPLEACIQYPLKGR